MNETGKQRASRIPLDYFKSADFYARWKNRLMILALAIPLIWLGSGLLQSDQGEMRFSRGPVAQVHAMWDAQCGACHTPFEPISENNVIHSVFGTSKSGTQRCTSCHAGPPHHASATPDLSCAACHREHRGRDASLVRLPNDDCTRCHAVLVHHTTMNKTEFANVTEFSKKGHPDFRLPDKTQRGLKFSHERHMRPGMTLPGNKDGKGFRLRDLQPADRERYAQGKKDLDASVELTCASCHRLEPGDFQLPGAAMDTPAMLRPRGGVGDYMVPITYDNQCKACHPLTLSFSPGKRDPAERDSKKLTIPHGLQPEQVKQFVWGALAEYEVRSLMKEWIPPPDRPLPGKEFSALEKKVAHKIDDLVINRVEKFLYRDALSEAEKLLFLGEHTCGRCHDVGGAGELRRIAPTQVPSVWFKHAKFSHAKHRAMDCVACHDKAITSGRQGQVLIPRIDNCLQCHGAQVSGGARSDCTECHTYHHRGQPGVLQMGLGAAARDPAIRLRDLQHFLKGTPKPQHP